MKQVYSDNGLSDNDVLENRAKYGANVFSSPQKETFLDRIRTVCRHPIALFLFLLTGFSIVVSTYLSKMCGVSIWVMPVIFSFSSCLVIAIGLFGGFNDSLYKILIAAFILSLGISTYKFECLNVDYSTFFEPLGIICALLLATGVAYLLEKRNEKTFQSLNDVNDETPVKVIRNHNVCMKPRKEIVVDDIVILEAGEEVPADCLLLDSLNLRVNESSLTGELQCSKNADYHQMTENATYPSDQIYKGTTIIEGNCIARVIAVGDNTECGKVFVAARVVEGEPTPLGKNLDKLASFIAKASYCIAGLVVAGRILSFFFTSNSDLALINVLDYLLNTLMMAVTLVVVAVPEGLPMAVTLSLAFSMKRLMKEHTLPRTMHACETLGATSVICTDKTGTLTQNKMTVYQAELENSDLAIIEEMIASNTTADLDYANPEAIRAIGNPTEGALLLWLDKQGKCYHEVRENIEIINRLPFTTENKYMATIVRSHVFSAQDVLYVKGAPESIFSFVKMSKEKRHHYEELLNEYQRKAMRTLALAYLPLEETDEIFIDGKLNVRELDFGGIFAISDPIRTEVPQAIKNCIEAGIQIKIVTGDTPGTTLEIARQIGLISDKEVVVQMMTGSEFEALSDKELESRIGDLKILARARPHDKERLVRMLRARGQVVTATGDGTNDAPALNAADVGLSMGDGTAVAKEASDMTIQDNSFHTIANAVMWGRSLYKNIQRFILFQMTINVVACLVVLVGSFTGTDTPLTVTQMLWVNLIMDTFAAIALASLPPSDSVMTEMPRPVNESIISRAMLRRIIGVGITFALILLVLLVVMLHSNIVSLHDFSGFEFVDYNGLSQYELSLFFSFFVMLQFWNMFNAKAFMTGRSAFSNLVASKGLILVAAVIFIGQIIIVECFGQMFNVCHIHFMDWITIIATTSLTLIIGEAIRLFHK